MNKTTMTVVFATVAAAAFADVKVSRMFSDSMVTNHSQTLKLSRNPSSARNEIHRYWTNVKITMTSA